MKTTTRTALALIIVMLLLVAMAAVFFAFQERIEVEASKENELLQNDNARLQLNHEALQATSTKISSAQATAAAESFLLAKELAQTDLTVTAQAAEAAELLKEMDTAQATRQFYEDTGPLVSIIEPQLSDIGIVNDEMTLIIVASDAAMVKSINISIGDNLIEDVAVTPGQSVVVRQPWTPDIAGPAIITVTAVNENDITSQPAAITIQVQDPTPTSTPSSTPSSTPTNTPTSTATSTPTSTPIIILTTES